MPCMPVVSWAVRDAQVYGIRRMTFNPKEHIVRVEFDASRFKEPVIAGLLRQAGLDVQERLVLA